MHRCAICKSPLAKNYTLFGTASRLCRALLPKSLVIRRYTRSILIYLHEQMRFFDRHACLTRLFRYFLPALSIEKFQIQVEMEMEMEMEMEWNGMKCATVNGKVGASFWK